MADRCRALTKAGHPCPMPPQKGRPWCFTHDPARVADRAAASALGGYNRRKRHAATPPTSVPLQTLADVLHLLELVAADVLQTENSMSRARTLTYLAATAIRGVELGELERRVAALEGRRAPTY